MMIYYNFWFSFLHSAPRRAKRAPRTTGRITESPRTRRLQEGLAVRGAGVAGEDVVARGAEREERTRSVRRGGVVVAVELVTVEPVGMAELLGPVIGGRAGNSAERTGSA